MTCVTTWRRATVILTTHIMELAEQMVERIGIINEAASSQGSPGLAEADARATLEPCS